MCCYIQTETENCNVLLLNLDSYWNEFRI